MSTPIELIATIFPKPGKTDRIIELLNGVSEHVKANEPDTLKYHIHREVNKKTGTDEVIVLETYRDKAAIGIHGSSKEFKAFGKKLGDEGLVDGPPQVKFVKPVGGFAARL